MSDLDGRGKKRRAGGQEEERTVEGSTEKSGKPRTFEERKATHRNEEPKKTTKVWGKLRRGFKEEAGEKLPSPLLFFFFGEACKTSNCSSTKEQVPSRSVVRGVALCFCLMGGAFSLSLLTSPGVLTATVCYLESELFLGCCFPRGSLNLGPVYVNCNGFAACLECVARLGGLLEFSEGSRKAMKRLYTSTVVHASVTRQSTIEETAVLGVVIVV